LKYSFVLTLLLPFWGLSDLFAQNEMMAIPGNDSAQAVYILFPTGKLTFRKIDDSTQITEVVKNVKLRQGGTYFYCDSCSINNRTNIFQAWGNVYINQGDTSKIYSSYLRYNTQSEKAYLSGGVKLTDGQAILTTPDLDYDMQTNIGIYLKGGKVVNKQTTVTSKEGFYYADMKDVYFKKNVVIIDPAYKITSDSILYNLSTRVARIIAQTTIVDSAGATIKTKEGYYDQKTGKAEFGQRPIIDDGNVNITANKIAMNDSIYQAEGNAIIIDRKNKTTILGGLIFQNKRTDAFLATYKPLLIMEQEGDSVYVSADTLFSAKLSPKEFKKDTSTDSKVRINRKVTVKDNDSTNRYFVGYRNVRIFNDSLQARADSVYYSFKDSVFKMFQRPVVWARNSQITGDTIHLYTRNRKAEKIDVFENAMLINAIENRVFNQVKSTYLRGMFTAGELDSVRARGAANCIYYVQDDDGSYTGVNECTSDVMDLYFGNRELLKVAFRSEVNGTLWPIKYKTPEEMRLPGFEWLEDKRPKTKFELYE